MSVDKLVDSSQLDADLTSVADAIRAKGETSASLAFPAGFISAVQAIPTGGGGGGTVEVASGTFTGSGTQYKTFTVGTKMAQTNFIVTCVLDDSEKEQPYNTTYKIVYGGMICDGSYASFDLSTDGNHNATSKHTFTVNNSGTITTLTDDGLIGCGHYIRNASISTLTVSSNKQIMITRKSTGFDLRLRFGTGSFTSGTYHYKILYYGDDPNNDIVEVV